MNVYENMKVLPKRESRREELLLLLRNYESTSQRGEKNSFYRSIEIDESMNVQAKEEGRTPFVEA